MNTLLILGAAAVAAGLGAVAIGFGREIAAHRLSTHALEAILDDDGDVDAGELSQPFAVRLLGPAWTSLDTVVRAITPGWWLERMRRHAVHAGLGRWGLGGVLAAKALCASAGVVLIVLAGVLAGADPARIVVWIVLAAVVGFFVPDLTIARRADARQAQIRRDLPETLDLLAIAVQAGLGLEAAIELVTRRIPGPLGDEVHRMLQEIQLGASRREALHALRERTAVSELSAFALALAQADELGTPLAEVLRAQASEMRMLRRQRAREQAAKTPVKLLFPLLIGIFPAMFVVIVGPAVISIVEAFGG